MSDMSRRDLMKTSAGLVAALAASTMTPGALSAAVHTARRGRPAARIRFGVIGINHSHIFGQVEATVRGGGELVAFHAREPDLQLHAIPS